MRAMNFTLAVEVRQNREAAVGAHQKAAESSAGMGRVEYGYTMQNCGEQSRGRTRRGECPGARGRRVPANRPKSSYSRPGAGGRLVVLSPTGESRAPHSGNL